MTLPVLSACLPEEIAGFLHDVKTYRAQQIFSWISRGCADFEAMLDLPQTLRTDLKKRFRLRGTSLFSCHNDDDGTAKLRIKLDDGAIIEAVLLVDGGGRRTACLSTQAGCAMACVFCQTGQLGFLRNLSPAEIVEQFFYLRDKFGPIDNLVFMGMGEPLLNLENLRKAIAVLCYPGGLALSPRRISLSTCGIIKGINDLTQSGPPVRLALSLVSADQSLRTSLMPAAKTNPLSELKSSLMAYQQRWKKRLTLEIVLLKGINCSQADAEAVARFSAGLKVLVNLIAWNPINGMLYKGKDLRKPSPAEIKNYYRTLQQLAIPASIRLSKGLGVSGACGQLGSLEAIKTSSQPA